LKVDDIDDDDVTNDGKLFHVRANRKSHRRVRLEVDDIDDDDVTNDGKLFHVRAPCVAVPTVPIMGDLVQRKHPQN